MFFIVYSQTIVQNLFTDVMQFDILLDELVKDYSLTNLFYDFRNTLFYHPQPLLTKEGSLKPNNFEYI